MWDRHVKYLSDEGFYVVGLDKSPEATRYLEEEFGGADKMEIVKSGIDRIPFREDYFDSVISSHVIHHTRKEEREGAFSEIERTLNEGGFFFLRTISNKHDCYGQGREIEENTFIEIEDLPDGDVPHHFFTKEELTSYFDNYEILQLEHHTSPPQEDQIWDNRLDEWDVLARKN